MSGTQKRPTKLSPERAKAAAGEIADELIKYQGMSAGDRNGIIADIIRCARMHMDGYEIARALERLCSWDCNLDIAEELDRWSDAADRQMQEQEAEWAAANDILPGLPVGTRIVLPAGDTGTIEAVHQHSVAKYIVKMDAEQSTNVRSVIRFEDARALETAP